jgi:hypothetical protein
MGLGETDNQSVVEMTDAVMARFGHIDILVNTIAAVPAIRPSASSLTDENGSWTSTHFRRSIINIASMYGGVVPYKYIYENTRIPRTPIVYDHGAGRRRWTLHRRLDVPGDEPLPMSTRRANCEMQASLQRAEAARTWLTQRSKPDA